MLVAHNNISTLIRKETIAARYGDYITIFKNTVAGGPIQVGYDETDRSRTSLPRTTNTVVDSNIHNDVWYFGVWIDNYAQDVVVRNNVFKQLKGQQAINIEATKAKNDPSGNFIGNVWILNNTAINSTPTGSGNFLTFNREGGTGGTDSPNQIFVQNNLNTSTTTFNGYNIRTDSPQSFDDVDHNVWVARSSGVVANVNDQDVNLSGWKSAVDSTSDITPATAVTVDPANGYKPTTNAADIGNRLPAAVFDRLGKKRPATGVTSGAAERNPIDDTFVPAPPSGLTATTISGSRIDLTWNDNSGNEDGFRIQWRVAGSGTWNTISPDNAANDKTFSHTGLTSGTTYEYQVAAVNTAGTSAYSAAAAATTAAVPAAPSALSATPVSHTQVDLGWTDNASNETGFRIQWRVLGSTTWNTITPDNAADDTTFSHTGRTAATTYEYQVAAVNAAGTSPYAGPVTARTADDPVGPTFTYAAVDDAYVRGGPTYSNTNFNTSLLDIKGAATTSDSNREVYLKFSIADFTEGVASAKVRLYGRSDNATTATPVGAFTVADDTWTETTIVGSNRPAAGTTELSNVSVVGTSNQWHEWDVTAYVQAARAAGDDLVTVALRATQNLAPVLHLESEESSQPGPQLVLTRNAAAPSNVTAAVRSDSEVELTWVDESAMETGYRVEWRTAGSGSWTAITPDLPAGTGGYVHSGRSTGTDYEYRVGTVTAAGVAWSDPVAVRVPTFSAAPTGLAATAVSSTQLDLTWTDASDNEIGFRIEWRTAGSTVWNTITPDNAAGDATFSHAGRTPGTSYEYRVAAVNADRLSAYSNTATATTTIAPSGSPTRFEAVHDAYVRDGAYADTNFNTALLDIKGAPESSSNREVYLKFDTTALGESVASAKVRLYGRSDNATTATPVGAFPVADTTWDEATITELTKPVAGTTALSTVNVVGTTNQWYEWDVSSYVQSERAAGRTVVTIALRATANLAPVLHLESEESSQPGPQLVVVPSFTRNAVADSYVREDSYANTNFGSDSLIVKSNTTTDSIRETYLRFDLSTVPSVGVAKLRLSGKLTATGSPVAVNVYSSTDTTWGESTITWNNKPAASATSLGSFTVSGTNTLGYEVDLTSFLQAEKAAGRDLVTLVLKAPVSSDPAALLYSDETGAGLGFEPQLVVVPSFTHHAVADSYVREDSYANQNFGSVDMIVKSNTTTDSIREAYLRFDLSTMSSVSSAKLRLSGKLTTTGSPVAVNVYSSTDTTWGESTITWNNKPAASATSLGSFTVSGTNTLGYEVDLTSFLQAEKAAGRDLVTLVLKAPVSSDPAVLLYSDETVQGPGLRPQLVMVP